MARSKATPERTAIARSALRAFARRQRTGAPDEDADGGETEDKPTGESEPPAATPPGSAAQEVLDIEPPPPKGEPWPDATPEPMRPIEPARAHAETLAMTSGAVGAPPAMPTSVAPPPLPLGTVENPTHMPGPREIPQGNPEDPAPAPGHVPRGDSRSMRRDNEFALIYRVATSVISRVGVVGTRGQWRVVEYPTSAAAAHAYAKECSRFVSEGFSDYRA
jgi:hypothetical protein